MNDSIHVLMTVYNEAEFFRFAYNAIKPYFPVTVVEGAYQESIAIGASPRSNDGTLEICEEVGVKPILANEPTDKDQRNVGLAKIKDCNAKWLLIIDGDEVYRESEVRMIQSLVKRMERDKQFAAYFKSLTFVNDFEHFCVQNFPRLFRLSPECVFVNDNFMEWPDHKLGWAPPHVISYPQIAYFHYGFCKSKERFELKKRWWESRFPGTKYQYSWSMNSLGQIVDPGHQIHAFNGKHPDIMQEVIIQRKNDNLKK